MFEIAATEPHDAVAREPEVQKFEVTGDDGCIIHFAGSAWFCFEAEVTAYQEWAASEITRFRIENESLGAELDQAAGVIEDRNAELDAAEAQRDAAIARAEEAERKLAERPLTAAVLAEALQCFSNPAIGAMHAGLPTECAIAQGLDAVAWRLEELSKEIKP